MTDNKTKEARQKLVGHICGGLTFIVFIISGILIYLMYQDPAADTTYPINNWYLFTAIKLIVGVMIIDFFGMLYTGSKRY